MLLSILWQKLKSLMFSNASKADQLSNLYFSRVYLEDSVLNRISTTENDFFIFFIFCMPLVQIVAVECIV